MNIMHGTVSVMAQMLRGLCPKMRLVRNMSPVLCCFANFRGLFVTGTKRLKMLISMLFSSCRT